jgi:4-amino-4-deoxy-L-arabinose transferase-like glycosyltransferase
MSLQRQAVWAFSALLALGMLVLFWALGSGRINIYDEGLYGMYGRTLLRYGVLLHAVDVHGDFPTGLVKFSKPPLSVWAVAASFKLLGPSLFALRLPFALASLAVTLLAFAFGRLLEPGARGVWLGFAWGVTWLICYGTYDHGRTATIEPMLLAFVMAALYAHARALASTTRPLGWALLAGLAVSGAFFTKQLVCALAVLPMLVVEWRRRHERPRTPQVLRLMAALGTPALLASAWIGALYAKVGFATFRVLWNHAIVRRVSGFDGVHHQNYLNRVAELLDVDALPFSWQVGLLGLGLLWLEKARARNESSDGAWLIGSCFVCSWLAFDVGSRAILPWYVLTLLPPLALGNAWLVVRAVASVIEPAAHGGGRMSALIAAGGALALALASGLAALSFMPSPLALALALCAIVYCLREPPPPAARVRVLLAAFGCMLALGTFSREHYRGSDPDPLSALGQILYARGKTRISVDSRAQVHPYVLTTFFGADAEDTSTPPWQLPAAEAKQVQAWVEALCWPREVQPRAGVEVLREAGVLAWVGDLSQPPYAADALRLALDRGPLTFEAEHMESARFYTLDTDAQASNRLVRTANQRLLERVEDFSLAKGHTPELPRGRYVASFWLKMRCTGYRGESLGEARVSSKRMPAKKKLLDCRVARTHDPEAFTPLEVPFSLAAATPIDLELRSSQGEVSLDRVTIRLEREPPAPP